MAPSPGKTLMLIGGMLLAAGCIVTLLERTPLRLGRLPGDIVMKGRYGSFYFPIVTCLLLSAVFSIAMWLMRKR